MALVRCSLETSIPSQKEEAFASIDRLVLEQKLVETDLKAPGEVHTPLDYAPAPHSLAHTLFSDNVAMLLRGELLWTR